MGKNILLGPPGFGQTHLSITLGYAAITASEFAHFTTARDLFAKLPPSERSSTNFRGFAAHRAKLLIIDAIGDETLDHVAAARFFRLICACCIVQRDQYQRTHLPSQEEAARRHSQARRT